jgi:recombinational DNA repair protein RecR
VPLTEEDLLREIARSFFSWNPEMKRCAKCAARCSEPFCEFCLEVSDGS